MKKAILGALVLACGGGGEAEGTPSCDADDRDGTYLISWEEHAGGTCGPLPESLGRLSGDRNLPNGCKLSGTDRWSDAECTFERSLECDGVDMVAITTSNADASRITGVVTMTDGVCLSTYDVDARVQ